MTLLFLGQRGYPLRRQKWQTFTLNPLVFAWYCAKCPLTCKSLASSLLEAKTALRAIKHAHPISSGSANTTFSHGNPLNMTSVPSPARPLPGLCMYLGSVWTVGCSRMRRSACEQQHAPASCLLCAKFDHGRHSGMDEAVRKHVRPCASMLTHDNGMAQMQQLWP